MMSVVSVKLLGAIFLLLQLDLLLSNSYYRVAAAKQVGCIEKERHALLELKAGLVADDTYILSSWDSKSDCCEWKGVICSNQTGHVEMLDLSGDPYVTSFRGEISTSLMELPHLKYLNLSWNYMLTNEHIPEFLGSLSNLRFLDLKYSQFGGRIPNDLASLSHLQYLDLSFNMLEGTIPYQLGNLSHLQYLDISENDLAGTIPHQLGRLSNLQELHLGYNEGQGLKVDDDKKHAGGEWLSNLTLLTHLDLSMVHNLNYSHGWLQMIAMLPKIEELKLSDCDLSDHYLLYLSRSMLNFSTSLKILDLSENTFSSSIIFQWVFDATSNLTELDLSYNLFEGFIPYDFGNIRNPLERLDLSGNNLHGGIPESFGDICTLHSLDLDSINLNENISTILHNLSGCARYSLQELILGDNQITGTLPDFSIFPSLKEIDLSINLLRGELPDGERLPSTLESLKIFSNSLEGGIPKSFGNLCSLRTLYLSNNTLSEDLSVIIQNLSVGCVKYSLQRLYLEDNKITGTLPDLSIFPSLKEIFLSINLLRGELPDGERLPSTLESLEIESNSLEGGIPKSFGDLCSLRTLYLYNNTLSEDLSVIIQNLSVGCAKYSLQQLDLGDNKITGTIPDMSVFSSLETLSLFGNLLNGKILNNSRFPYQLNSLLLESNNLKGVLSDSNFGNMSMLEYIDLSYNSLTLKFSDNWVPPFQLDHIYLGSCILGPNFPKWLQSQKNLLGLDISGAGISDVVPAWFWAQTSKLDLMNISYNNLTGTIPNLPIRFSKGHAILASNQFEGSIPPFLRSAASLDLSNNKFSEAGELLCANTTIDTLEMLDLSKNRLSMQLPDCWSHFKALVFLDLSNNNLSGKVPSSMGSLIELKVLILRSNNLVGKLPFSLKNCTKLVMLDLGENKLSGPIPSWTGQRLQMLSLRENLFSGNLPQNLCYLTGIQLLDLSVNNLSGQIFKCIKNFTAMSQKGFSTKNVGDNYYSYKSVNGETYKEIYDLFALLMWKGAERLFKNNKLILRTIDLSSNQLTGEIPEEIGKLVELVSLNLSSNNLTGEITSEIGRLTSLEFLDLSRNHFFGSIPPSLVQIDRLSMLNLSNNNFSGRIPIGTQLQSFDASSYEGNANLCGKPLDKKCPGDEEAAPQEPETPEESTPEDKKSIYLSVALGFITGFWGLWGSLLLNRTWRHAYMLFLNNLIDTVYVFTVMNAAKFQRWFRGLLEKFV